MRFKKNERCVLLTVFALCLFVLSACALMESHKIPGEQPGEQKEMESHKIPGEKTETEIKVSPEESLKETLSGMWKRSASGDKIEFLQNGTVRFYSAVENAVYPGTYRIDDEKHVTTQLEQGGSITWGFVVSKNELQLTAPSGLVLKYRKVP